MLSTVAQSRSMELAASQSAAPVEQQPSNDILEEQEAFQKFSAGTFYQTMMKALRSTEKETKYFNGGRAEKIFRAEFDQHVASAMAEEHGDKFAGPLFDQFASQVRFKALQQNHQTAQQGRQPTSADKPQIAPVTISLDKG